MLDIITWDLDILPLHIFPLGHSPSRHRYLLANVISLLIELQG